MEKGRRPISITILSLFLVILSLGRMVYLIIYHQDLLDFGTPTLLPDGIIIITSFLYLFLGLGMFSRTNVARLFFLMLIFIELLYRAITLSSTTSGFTLGMLVYLGGVIAYILFFSLLNSAAALRYFDAIGPKALILIFKNAFRRPLRTILTIIGLAITIMAFGIVRDILEVFNFSQDDLVPGHLISRHKTSMMQFLPITHLDKMRQVDGVKHVTYSHWIGIRYGDDPEGFFMRMSVDHENFYKVRTDWNISDEALEAFQAQKNAVLITPHLALSKEWKEGQQVTIGCDYFETVSIDVEVVGQMEFKSERNAELDFMIIRGDLFRQAIGASVSEELEHQVGWIELIADPPEDAAKIGLRVDSVFANSDMETRTETVNAYANAQIDRFRTIITILQVSSYLMIVVILLVLLNTMSMVARERISENAVLKTLGFRLGHLIAFNFGESMLVALLGGVLGAFLIWPGVVLFKVVMPFLEQVEYKWITLLWVAPAMIGVGILASLAPIIKAGRTTIVEGLRTLE